jgi:hypothetical protein
VQFWVKKIPPSAGSQKQLSHEKQKSLLFAVANKQQNHRNGKKPDITKYIQVSFSPSQKIYRPG